MSLLEPQRTRPRREVEIKKEKGTEIVMKGELGRDILYIESWVSVSRQYVFTLPHIVLCQLFLTGKTVREIGKGILCIPTKW